MKTRDALQKIIYGVYDLKENLIFTGDIEEVMKFTSLKRGSVHNAVYNGHKVRKKYFIEKVGYEDITEKKCRVCGRILPVEDFYWHYRKSDGEQVPGSVCRSCHCDYLDEKKENLLHKEIKAINRMMHGDYEAVNEWLKVRKLTDRYTYDENLRIIR